MYVELRVCNCFTEVCTAHHCSDELHTSAKLTENSYREAVINILGAGSQFSVNEFMY